MKYFSSPLCLKLRIMSQNVTHPVTGYKCGMQHNASVQLQPNYVDYQVHAPNESRIEGDIPLLPLARKHILEPS